ncbi:MULTISPECIES: ABC-three component system protein [unclassified Arsenophonus]|uniref:ABC-three component system protein n=1 Tax=unclassified Arsenophonus TaxID=2627083 RepID=UPI002863C9D3|nr:ABC-three component system protein [Arsenophonus sp.]MDR5610604.1 hypothetical protein [Arsenophonus sp.]MDR5614394.1 hypothetical protein [Arsenophonus sp.]
MIVSPNDLSDIIYSLAKQLTNGLSTKSDPPTPRIPYKDKNLINNMSNEYAEAMRKKYLKETAQIRDFLAAPENLEIQNLYENVVDECQLKVIAKKKEFHSFDDIMNHLFDLLISRDHVLRKNKKLTRLMLFYMYWNCDIGSENYASAN